MMDIIKNKGCHMSVSPILQAPVQYDRSYPKYLWLSNTVYVLGVIALTVLVMAVCNFWFAPLDVLKGLFPVFADDLPNALLVFSVVAMVIHGIFQLYYTQYLGNLCVNFNNSFSDQNRALQELDTRSISVEEREALNQIRELYGTLDQALEELDRRDRENAIFRDSIERLQLELAGAQNSSELLEGVDDEVSRGADIILLSSIGNAIRAVSTQLSNLQNQFNAGELNALLRHLEETLNKINAPILGMGPETVNQLNQSIT